MASTTFVNYQTVIDAAWLNDVNSAVYSGTFQASTITPTNITSSGAISGATVAGTTSVTTPIVKSGTSLTLQTNGSTTAVTIDTSQNVGIGTASPAEKLTVTTSGSNVYTKTTDGTVNLYVGITNSSATAISGTISNHPYTFFTNNAERMRIDTSGNLLVGTTNSTPTGTNNSIIIRPGSASYFSASSTNSVGFSRYTTTGTVVNIDYAGATVGTIATNGTVCTFNSVSDYRLKENVAPMVGALATVSALKPVTYNWKADGSTGQGFIAHELQAVVPDCVVGEKDAVDADGKPKYQGIDTSFLVATLTAAIQELSAQVTTLQSQVTALQAKVGV